MSGMREGDEEDGLQESEEGAIPPPRGTRGSKRSREEPVNEDGLTAAEVAAETKARLRPRLGWTFDEATNLWRKSDCPYVVRFVAKRRKWSAEVAPFQVLSPAGTVLGGASHLWRAQKTAEELGQPLHDPRSSVSFTSKMRVDELPRFFDEEANEEDASVPVSGKRKRRKSA